jgi:transcriptional regulator with XRE-family HTH domain
MANQYYMNIKNFSLDKFKQILKTEEMLPARQILKDDIEERFEVLFSMGVHNLGDLIDALKTRQKVEDFAQRSGLSREYLIILRREARSFKPKVVPLREILGVDEENVDKLASAGIIHSKHLFEHGRTRAEREKLSAASGIPIEKLLELVKLSDLARIRGLGGAFVRLFYEAGADTIEKLSRWNPEELFQAVRGVNAEREITKWVPSLKDVRQYVEMANELAKVIEYE